MRNLLLFFLGMGIISCNAFTPLAAPTSTSESPATTSSHPASSPASASSSTLTTGVIPTPTTSKPIQFISILSKLWMPKGDTKINCVSNPSDGISEKCDDLVYGGTWQNIPGVGFCREHAIWTITLWNSSSLAAENFTCPDCETQARFPNAPSGEFNHDLTLGHYHPAGDLEVSAYYQEGPAVASGSLHSCEDSSIASGSWNLGIADGLAFIKPVKAWLESWNSP